MKQMTIGEAVELLITFTEESIDGHECDDWCQAIPAAPCGMRQAITEAKNTVSDLIPPTPIHNWRDLYRRYPTDAPNY